MDSDRIEGKAKEAAGTVTGDESLKREGEAQGAWGETKDKARDVWEDVKDAVDGDDEKTEKKADQVV